MKKSVLGLAVSALFMVGAAHAETNPNDVSATLSVTGTVVESISDQCSVNLSTNSINLESDVADLVNQGDATLINAAGVKTVRLSIAGGSECQDQVAQGKMAYKFTGTADDADGTVLANGNVSTSAATGVGIGLFTVDHTPIKINQDTMAATSNVGGDILAINMVKLNGQKAVAGDVAGSLTIEIERL
ncbi:fimbrial protein [Cronobacter sakazakii]|uniref:fimbrial protein n=1 Tax=Cronobacter sakazakii TaxID=28141 RepID=UPI000CFD6C58|nr:fimbrial protein [Cronobacter sakazakii]MDT3520062.1 fimbrial protein [Cronobacter sakazakii]